MNKIIIEKKIVSYFGARVTKLRPVDTSDPEGWNSDTEGLASASPPVACTAVDLLAPFNQFQNYDGPLVLQI